MSESIFDNVIIGEIETAENWSDVVEDNGNPINMDDYGDTYYFFAAKIHPSFALFVTSASRKMVDDLVEDLSKKLHSTNPQEVSKIKTECLQTLMGCSSTFDKYSHKGGARELEKYSKEGKQEYRDFCNDVALYCVYLKVFFNVPFPLWDIEQLKQIGLDRH
jgi:hypothetical protein